MGLITKANTDLSKLANKRNNSGLEGYGMQLKKENFSVVMTKKEKSTVVDAVDYEDLQIERRKTRK